MTKFVKFHEEIIKKTYRISSKQSFTTKIEFLKENIIIG